MPEAMVGGLQNLSPTVFAYMVVGVVGGTVVGIIPGLGGAFFLAIVLPFVYTMDPMAALAMLLAGASVIGTSNTVTAVLFGVPGNVSGIALVFDGYPLAKQGQARRALTAGFVASAVGGLLGAGVLALMLPVVRPVVLAFGHAEFFVLILVALVFMARMGQGNALKGLIAAGLGIWLTFIGQESGTGVLRFTFGQLYLWDGIPLVPLIIGLFAITEMMLLIESRSSVARSEPALVPGQTWLGILDVFRHWKTTIRSSAVGAGVGLLPGLGAEAAQFLAYSQAARLSPKGHLFGKGEIEGVIAADAATNAKDGGSLVPTLVFGIPGSPPMAIFLSALLVFGVRPGAGMLTGNLEFVWTMIWVLILSNIMAVVLVMAFTGTLSRLTFVRPAYIAPPILVAGILGSYFTNNHIGDIYVALLAGIVGYMMVRADYSRVMLVIGFVLGPLLESHYLLAMRLFGLSFLMRPLVILIVGLGCLVLAWPLLVRVRQKVVTSTGH